MITTLKPVSAFLYTGESLTFTVLYVAVVGFVGLVDFFFEVFAPAKIAEQDNRTTPHSTKHIIFGSLVFIVQRSLLVELGQLAHCNLALEEDVHKRKSEKLNRSYYRQQEINFFSRCVGKDCTNID